MTLVWSHSMMAQAAQKLIIYAPLMLPRRASEACLSHPHLRTCLPHWMAGHLRGIQTAGLAAGGPRGANGGPLSVGRTDLQAHINELYHSHSLFWQKLSEDAEKIVEYSASMAAGLPGDAEKNATSTSASAVAELLLECHAESIKLAESIEQPLMKNDVPGECRQAAR